MSVVTSLTWRAYMADGPKIRQHHQPAQKLFLPEMKPSKYRDIEFQVKNYCVNTKSSSFCNVGFCI